MAGGVDPDIRATQQFPVSQFADTDTAGPSSDAVPVFVDATGHRRRLIRRAAIGLLAVICAYGVAVVLSFLGGPVPPNALIPLPGVPHSAPDSPASPGTANSPTPGITGSATHTGAGNAGGGTPGSVPTSARAGAPSPSSSLSPSASPSPTGNRHVPPGHVGRSASPGPSSGHGH
jgi:hypothetical protein